MLSFLKHQLPSKGLYCAAQVAAKGYIHRFFDTVEALASHIAVQDAAGHTMYIAQATFKTPENRKTENAAYVNNFFMDIDAGLKKFAETPDKAYPTQVDACRAIKEFAEYMQLPLPSIVNSGNGLYSFWHITEDIPADKWKVLASMLKKVAHAAGFKQDPSRTSDTSSVLRPVGSTNRKGEPKPVKLIHRSEPMTLEAFVNALNAAATKNHIVADALHAPSKFHGLNDDFTSGVEGPQSSLFRVAEQCAQVRKVKDTLGNVDEPLWYAFLGMAIHTEEGKNIVILHEWSKGHPDYTSEGTFAKIQQLQKVGHGPTTCAKFSEESPSGCVGCPHANKVKSPIVLGRPEPVSIATVEEEEVLPRGFKRDANGMFWSEDGKVWHRFYPYDIYVVALAFDNTLGYEVATIRHKMPISLEYSQFTIRAALLHDPKALLMALSDNHVQTTGGEARKQMINYIDNAMAQMRAKRRLTMLHSQMGWKDEGAVRSFVLGDMLYQRDEDPISIGFAKNVPEAARAFCSKGDLAAWSAKTRYMGLRNMEPFAFGFLAGAFGAPLIKFTGFAGAMVALIGDSGIGKTLLGEWIMSVYGDSKRLILLKDDTKNFLVQRLGLYGSLPLYVDEISNIEGQELSDLVYKITQGRDKGRLSRSGNERAVINSWSTIAVASSNHSLNDKLSALKVDASAEMNRLMEINACAVPEFGRTEATEVYHTFHDNYGLAGPIFIDYITKHQDQHKDKIDQIIKALDISTGATAEERFWSAVAASAIYGGLIAQKLGLIQFQVTPILKWVKEHIIEARDVKVEQVTNYLDYLGQFIDTSMRGVIVVETAKARGDFSVPKREPSGNLVCRIEEDTMRMFISRSALKDYLARTYGSYSKLKTELEKCGAMVDSNRRKVLGSGTKYSGTQQPTWEIDLRCPSLGYRTMSAVKNMVNDAQASVRS